MPIRCGKALNGAKRGSARTPRKIWRNYCSSKNL